MNKMKRVVVILTAIAACVLCLYAFGAKAKIFADNFDKPNRFVRTWTWSTDMPGTVEYLPDGGVDGSGCVKISSSAKTALAVKHKLKGLHPGKLYRVSARMKCDSVQDGRGAVLYLDPEGLDQSWNASEFAYGTNDWAEVYMDFVPDRNGEAVICCGLGFPWGTYNGGKASGTVWYDDVKVVPTPEEAIYSRESEHIVLRLDRDKVTISDAEVDAWLAMLDRTYEAYCELIGEVPFDGRKIIILNTPGIEPGYWALVIPFCGTAMSLCRNCLTAPLSSATGASASSTKSVMYSPRAISKARDAGTGTMRFSPIFACPMRSKHATESCRSATSVIGEPM